MEFNGLENIEFGLFAEPGQGAYTPLARSRVELFDGLYI